MVSQLWKLEGQRAGSFWGVWRRCVPCLCLGFSGFAGNLWCPLVCWDITPSLPSLPPGMVPVLSVCRFLLFIKTPGTSWQGPPSVGPHFNRLHLPRPDFQIRSHSEVLRIRAWTYEFVQWGARFNLWQMTNDQPLQPSYRGNSDSRIFKLLISPLVLRLMLGTQENVQWGG